MSSDAPPATDAANSTSPSPTPPNNFEVGKDAAAVVLHAQARALQLGAGVGLLVALPALTLAPMKFNRADAPPLVAAASLAATGATIGISITTPAAIFRLYTVGAEGVASRAKLLRENVGQRRVDVVGGVGAVAGLALEGVRVRAVAAMSGVSFREVAGKRESAMEAFGFAVAGSAVAIGAAVLVSHISSVIAGQRGKDSSDDGAAIPDGGGGQVVDVDVVEKTTTDETPVAHQEEKTPLTGDKPLAPSTTVEGATAVGAAATTNPGSNEADNTTTTATTTTTAQEPKPTTPETLAANGGDAPTAAAPTPDADTAVDAGTQEGATEATTPNADVVNAAATANDTTANDTAA